MPTVSVEKQLLCDGLGGDYTDEQLDELLFDFGLELDDVVEEDDPSSSKKKVVCKIEIPANRYDLLCLEGLLLGLRVYLGQIDLPQFVLEPADESLTMVVRPTAALIRPYVVCAVLRGVHFDPTRYASFIDLQDKLHHNICRKRSLASVGTHDLDSLAGPFVYEAQPPQDIKFIPLNQTQPYTADALMQLYSGNSHLKPYLPIIRDSPVYPVIRDSAGTVLSLPPIINGDHSKISLKTRNIFFEVTATDRHKADIVLDTLVTLFSLHCERQFHVERVKVVYEETSEEQMCPALTYRRELVDVSECNETIGVSVEASKMAELLKRMCLQGRVVNESSVEVVVPPTRHDIIHACDIYEDLAIAYGYNNIEMVFPRTHTVASEFQLNHLTDQLRNEMARNGFTEGLTFALCSRDDVSTKLRKSIDHVPAVHIANPKTLEFQVARTTLLPGLLKTLANSKNMPLPLRLFELSDVVLTDKEKDVGTRNRRRLCVVYYGKTSGFEVVHGILDRIMLCLQVHFSGSGGDASADRRAAGLGSYRIVQSDDPTFFSGRCADILYTPAADGHSQAMSVGRLGVLHPEVLAEFDLALPVSCFEIDIEPFL